MLVMTDRLREAQDGLTLAVATGLAISSSKEAFEAWRRAQGGDGGRPSAAEQRATIARLARLFPGAVKRS